jgi:nucleotide-binding universal stress UspA family protein
MTRPVSPSQGPILLATRLDADAGPVARAAARLARALDRELVVLYVAVELETVPIVAAQGGLDETAVENQIRREVETRVRAFAAAQLGDTGVRVRIGLGPVVDSIVEHAGEEGAELIVVGHHEHGVLSRLFEGDPAHALLDRTPCPIVVVPCP